MWDLSGVFVCTFARTSKKGSFFVKGTDVYCPLLRPTRWFSVSRFIQPFALVVEQLTLLCMKKNTFVAMLRFLSGIFPFSCRLDFCFFKRQVYAEVRSDGSKQKLHFDHFAGAFLGCFVLQLDSLGFGFPRHWHIVSHTELEKDENLLSNKKSMVIPMDLRSKTYLDDWMVGRK